MTTDHAYARLVAANPVDDPERFMATMVDIEASLREFEEEVMDTITRENPQVVNPPPQRRWQIAAATFVVVLVAVGALLLSPLGSEPDAVGEVPVDVVDAYFERWNDGNVGAALSLVNPDASINGGLQDWHDIQGLMTYAIQFDGTMETVCDAGPDDVSVNCSWAWRTAASDALALEGIASARFVVRDGLITAFQTPNYGRLDGQLGAFAKTTDAAGFEAACTPDGESPVSQFGFPFNKACGSFLAGFEAAFVSSLGS